MPRIRVRRTARGLVDPEVYERAFLDISERRSSLRLAARRHGVSHVTLLRYCRRREEASRLEAKPPGYSGTRVFTVDQENRLQSYVKMAADVYFGLSPQQVEERIGCDSTKVPLQGSGVPSGPCVVNPASLTQAKRERPQMETAETISSQSAPSSATMAADDSRAKSDQDGVNPVSETSLESLSDSSLPLIETISMSLPTADTLEGLKESGFVEKEDADIESELVQAEKSNCASKADDLAQALEKDDVLVHMSVSSVACKDKNADSQSCTGSEVTNDTEETVDSDAKEDSTATAVGTVDTLEEGEDSNDVTEDTAAKVASPYSNLTETAASNSAVEDEAPSVEDGASNEVNSSGKFVDTDPNDLDYLMDIGTVDQEEQEAQMNKDDQEMKSVDETERDVSPSISYTDKSPVETYTDEKPSALPPTTADEQEDKLDSVVDSTIDGASSLRVNGMKVASTSTSDDGGAQMKKCPEFERVKPSNSPPPVVKVKDEPVDEEYNAALTPSASSTDVKDEPPTPEDNLKISSIYSVGGKVDTGSPAASQSTPASKAAAPVVPAQAFTMSCVFCKKALVRGQTAFQRRGSPDLFCSSACLTSNAKLPTVKSLNKTCHLCLKSIARPQDVILAPVDAKGSMKEFCSQACLTSFNYKRNQSTAVPVQQMTQPSNAVCSICNTFCFSQHEVVLQGAVHKICSDGCFERFRLLNNLTVAKCGHCGTLCTDKPVTLKMADVLKTFCATDCLVKFKEKIKTPLACATCRTTRLLKDMVEHKDGDETVTLFCSSNCVLVHKVQSISTSGIPKPCDKCEKMTTPAYHLAMSDVSIRNFCSLPCVMAYQEDFRKQQKQSGGQSTLAPAPVLKAPPPPVPTSILAPAVAPVLAAAQPEHSKAQGRLNCAQCSRHISCKPELIQIKDKLVFVCSPYCSQTYKMVNALMSVCEYCKLIKVPKDVKRVNHKNCYFCSDGCKLLFMQDLSSKWGNYCHGCAYCHSVTRGVYNKIFGTKAEQFCSKDCRNKYTGLFNQLDICDSCGRQGKLTEDLPLLGTVKHFCNMACTLRFCVSKEALGQGPKDQVVVTPGSASTATPVIANVVSLANSPAAGQPGTLATKPLQGAVPSNQTKLVTNRYSQTDTTKAPPPAPTRVLKNKALLCRPMVQNKGITCKPQTVDCEAQTGDPYPRVIVLPVPVPVFVPVPMNLYSQLAPHPLALPLPIPVPMFLPVATSSAERLVETIRQIKEKIPSDPLEADLILMAEMVAEQEGGKGGGSVVVEEEVGEDNGGRRRRQQKESVAEKERGRPEALAPDDHVSNYSDDLDTDDLATFLSNWEDSAGRSPERPFTNEKLQPIADVPVDTPSDVFCELQSPASPPLDIEADLPAETLEEMSLLRKESQREPSPPPPSRRQTSRKAKAKGRKSRQQAEPEVPKGRRGRPLKVVSREPPKLESKYGIDVWKKWIQGRDKKPDLEKPRVGSRPLELKEDVLRCTTTELSYGLCRFVAEVRRPNGEPYSPDSLFYLCLGIQQHLFENGRVENIFTDVFYNRFSMEITKILKGFAPSITATGYVHSRVEEDYLWDCKQLGAYSPTVLLNTLLFFCSKHFGFTTLEQHRRLSFSNIMRCTKASVAGAERGARISVLRFYPPLPVHDTEADADSVVDEGVPAKKRKGEEKILEMAENSQNPLRCPVRLYEFYLSKCSESVKQRTDTFYLQPERSCVPNSPMWFSSIPLADGTLEAMLTRILTVRELHLHRQDAKGGGGGGDGEGGDDPAFTPDLDEGDESDW